MMKTRVIVQLMSASVDGGHTWESSSKCLKRMRLSKPSQRARRIEFLEILHNLNGTNAKTLDYLRKHMFS